ncbi:TIGR04282 family arsenosugar biosynthesis glycosyltransferase [Planktothrix sp. FACHB-1355]|uniref:TIGR04282 family arsenosugar biosynthesis glycosyltransferase n=1 Tax=Aerosakkonema funiforme FACHB-1375 TaxID=2949571 RepID=A0A926ZJ20_9CYAN|nr:MULTISPECIES: TIGR04282 family arsenosugar biosynthesis glycosyltransferase [Oscillatoriales]MBD2183877.1 TIGR04282 family arsenosugar biosynthesis glycosyltransferase [Aerosakkonema funiforme FACHB-1375]MBD3560416.1 TIGR04282 family arsenosugar biosynthesis glycosyltransferase [Planktothrix sp. FACHB-1355]
MKECLILFTRYPEPGKAKTRLIPVLGAEGAANLHRQMTENAIAQAKQLQSFHSLSLEVHFTGGNFPLMQEWLGNEMTYRQQAEGNIGFRMASAFQTAFSNNIDNVIIIGSDCPALNYEILAQAFQALQQHDLVLGPATDGGYYLIGLRHFIPQLFTDISWSTSEVFRQTVEIAGKLNLAAAYLTELSDVDRPEDLSILDFRFLISYLSI